MNCLKLHGGCLSIVHLNCSPFELKLNLKHDPFLFFFYVSLTVNASCPSLLPVKYPPLPGYVQDNYKAKTFITHVLPSSSTSCSVQNNCIIMEIIFNTQSHVHAQIPRDRATCVVCLFAWPNLSDAFAVVLPS